MLITLRLKKSLIVEQFQGNYLKYIFSIETKAEEKTKQTKWLVL